MYWWMNLIQHTKVLEAKQWYARDNPEAQGFTAEKMRELGVKGLAENMVGYTKNIPGTKANKKRLRCLILTMVRQIEIETRDERVAASGDIPCLFGTLTTERYHWDEIMKIIAQVEGVVDGQQASWIKGLSKSKRHELVNKYPLFVAWYCAVKLECQLKTVVIPCFGGHAYVAVFEWSPTGGMVHLHYILWKDRAPRFDLQAADLWIKRKPCAEPDWCRAVSSRWSTSSTSWTTSSSTSTSGTPTRPLRAGTGVTLPLA